VFPVTKLLDNIVSQTSEENKIRLEKLWKKFHQKRDDFLKARNGDHLMVPFECDDCVFWKITKRSPSTANQADKLLLECIGRSNLDAFWSRSSKTVNQNRLIVNRQLFLSKTLGMPAPYVQTHPTPEYDHRGFEVAVSMIFMSVYSGDKHSENHLQFDTVRRSRTDYGNYLRSSNQASHLHLSLVDQAGSYTRFSHDPCGSLWFHRFSEGMANRMGKIYLPNLAMSHKLIIKFFSVIEDKIKESKPMLDKHNWVIMSSYCTVSYILSLRGDEGFLLDINEMRKNWSNHSKDFIVITLLGKLKGEKEDSVHKFPCVNKTLSGIDIKNTLLRALNLKNQLGSTEGPLISDINGVIISPRVLDDMIHEVLIEIYKRKRTLFPISIKGEDDIISSYKGYRSFRRSSDTRALDMKVASTDIDIVNRWRVNERKQQGKRVAQQMKQHYSDFDKLIKPFLRYTSVM